MLSLLGVSFQQHLQGTSSEECDPQKLICFSPQIDHNLLWTCLPIIDSFSVSFLWGYNFFKSDTYLYINILLQRFPFPKITLIFETLALFQDFALTSQVVLVVKNPPANAGDVRQASLIPGQQDPLKEVMVIHYSILAETPMDRGAWQAMVHSVTNCQT